MPASLPALLPGLIAFRHRLHAQPELSGAEQATAAALATALRSCRPDSLLPGLGGQGLLASFQGAEPGPTVLLRADFDALPITECPQHDHGSQTPGVAHLCGHDGHSAVLLGGAQLLAEARPAAGRICLLFQPAEETGQGAAAVLADPAFATCQPDYVYAFHNLPGFPLGQLVLKEGAFTAAVRSLALRLIGRPCHAAEPEHGINPALAMAELLQRADALNLRDPAHPDFALVTPVHARLGELAYGTSAGEGELHFTLRSWQQTRMDSLSGALLAAVTEVAERHGLAVESRWLEEFAACHNDPAAASLLARVGASLGMPALAPACPFKWGEDFGLFTQRYPGALFGLGAGVSQAALHQADYDFPDDLLAPAIRLMHGLALAASDPAKTRP